MKIVRPLAITVLASAVVGCAVPPGSPDPGREPYFPKMASGHGRGADVAVWVADGYLSVSEEPIHRAKIDGRDIVFKLDNDSETAKYKFAGDEAVTIPSDPEHKQFHCKVRNEDVACERKGSDTVTLKYVIKVVRKDGSGGTIQNPPAPLDPFIITH
jgi:hypothetical protein